MFRGLAAIVLLAAALSASARADDKPANSPVKEIPKGAVANADGTWSYTDQGGKKWIYQKTQFGLSRMPVDAKSRAKLPPGLPKGAVVAGDGSYTWTDKNGKKWSYTMTPFGLSRAPYAAPAVGPDSVPSPPAGDISVRAIDEGDTVRFERKGPFGTTVWEKKKSDLNADERKIYDSRKAETQTK